MIYRTLFRNKTGDIFIGRVEAVGRDEAAEKAHKELVVQCSYILMGIAEDEAYADNGHGKYVHSVIPPVEPTTTVNGILKYRNI